MAKPMTGIWGFGAVAAAALGASLLAAGSAAAQEITIQGQVCGVSETEAPWIAGGEFESDIATAVDPLEMALEISGAAPRAVRFFLSEPMALRIEARGDTAGADTIIGLTGAGGEPLGSDDDGGGDRNSRFETFGALNPGAYCVSIQNYDAGVHQATIRVGRMEHPPLTTGADASIPSLGGCGPESEARALSEEGALNRVLAERDALNMTVIPNEMSLYRFSLDQATSLSISADNETADPVVRLYDGAGVLLLENDDHVGLNARLDVIEPLAAGDYCLEVYALNDGALPIEVAVEPFNEQAFLAGLYERGELSPLPGGDYPIVDLGPLEGTLLQDVLVTGVAAKWMSFEVTETSLVRIRVFGAASLDPIASLFGLGGEILDTNDDAFGTEHSEIVRELSPGVYTMAVTSYDAAIGAGAARIMIQRYVPVE